MMRLSICSAFHRRDRFLYDFLSSLLDFAKDFTDTEILLCDDGSNSLQQNPALEFQNRFPHLIRIIRNENNRGIAFSRQRMLEEAKGTYMLSFDSDDIFIPFDIKRDMDFLDRHLEYSATYGKKIVFQDGRGLNGMSHGGTYSTFSLLFSPAMNQTGMLMRRNDVLQYSSFLLKRDIPLPVAEDIFCWSRLGAYKNMLFRNENRAFYRLHPSQLTENYKFHYAMAYEAIQNDFICGYHELYQRLHSLGSINFKEEERCPATILCGILFARAQNHHEKMKWLNMAMLLSPDDNGVKNQMSQLLISLEKRNEAIGCLFDLLLTAEDEEILYYQCNIAKLVPQLFPDNNYLKNRFIQLVQKKTARYFQLTEVEEQIRKKYIR